MAIVGRDTWGGLFVSLLLLTHSMWEYVALNNVVSVCVCGGGVCVRACVHACVHACVLACIHAASVCIRLSALTVYVVCVWGRRLYL